MTDSKIDLTGPKILLQGDSGVGKTHALATMVEWAEKNGREVFVLFTENGLETLLGYWRDPPLDPTSGKPLWPPRPVPKNLHWHVSRIPAMDLKTLTAAAKDTGNMEYLALTQMKDGERGYNNPAYKLLEVLANFPDDRTGEKFGNIGTWGPEKVFAIDSLSELANAYVMMVIGKKPAMAQNEYGVAQRNLINFLRFQTQSLRCTFILTAHLQRQVNEITGATSLMTKAIGKAMSDDIPQLFSEVILCYREGATFWWSTAATGVVTKTRYLPIKEKIPPNLGIIMDKWLKRSTES